MSRLRWSFLAVWEPKVQIVFQYYCNVKTRCPTLFVNVATNSHWRFGTLAIRFVLSTSLVEAFPMTARPPPLRNLERHV